MLHPRAGSLICCYDRWPPLRLGTSMQKRHTLMKEASGAVLASDAWFVRFRSRVARPKARPRWLTASGTFSSNPAHALVVATPEAAARRLRGFVELMGLPLRVVERFALVAGDAVG
jgi:hypothetical protein